MTVMARAEVVTQADRVNVVTQADRVKGVTQADRVKGVPEMARVEMMTEVVAEAAGQKGAATEVETMTVDGGRAFVASSEEKSHDVKNEVVGAVEVAAVARATVEDSQSLED